MDYDPKSFAIIDDPLAAGYYVADTYDSTSIDMGIGKNVSYIVSCQGVAAGGTIDAKLQYSDDNITFTDEPDTNMGNSTSITQITAPGQELLHVINPRGRYYRVRMTVATNAVNAGVISVQQPLRHKAA